MKKPKIFDPLEGKFKPAPAIIREETAYLDLEHDVLSSWTDKKRVNGKKNEPSKGGKTAANTPV